MWIYWKHFQNGSTGLWDSDNCWTKCLWFSAISTTLENLLIIQSYSLWMTAAFFQASNASLIDSLHDLLSQGTFVVKRQNSDFSVISFVMVLYKALWKNMKMYFARIKCLHIHTNVTCLKTISKLLIADACIKNRIIWLQNMTKTFVQMYCLYSPLFSLGLGWKEDALINNQQALVIRWIRILEKDHGKQAFILQEYTFIPFKQFDRPLALEGSENQ